MQPSFYFNSIKVRLKLKSINTFLLQSIFQFHKGTIKTVETRLYIITFCLFQFHKGTIKTTLSFKRLCSRLLFQFHKGTIKTSLAEVRQSNISDFNSIKVRLKLATYTRSPFSNVFQFHKGTIKTSFCIENNSSVLNFNSIKVRLKPVKSKAYKPRRLYRFAGAKIQKNLQKNVDA